MEKYSHSIEIGRFKLIAINSELEREVQREQFYHELAHILRRHYVSLPSNMQKNPPNSGESCHTIPLSSHHIRTTNHDAKSF
ncbi:ImmA/IrrE family metallo-endopeptidase [Halalkalibacterium ligniniphilum]|uniref:ImmA/IrrE family metallo-endopeptidase n=1 Tax=Halalkalibacterium ligniniphilum TaxID=1134413 RepID=UPI001F25EC0D|nr:ImmA/IrrE family metallo-endopeptidase [Halalkalibacterium ligniniphilum]